MEPRHAVVATAPLTAALAQLLMYLTDLPLKPLDGPTAMAIAGLLVAAGGATVMAYRTLRAAPRPNIVPLVPRQPGGGK